MSTNKTDCTQKANSTMFQMLRNTLWPFVSETKRPFVLFGLALASVTATALSHVATPWMIGSLIDAAPRGDVDGLRAAVIGLFLVAVLASLGGGGRALAARRLTDLFRAHLQKRLMTHVLRLRLSDIEGRQNRRFNAVFTDDIPAVAQLANPIAMNVCLTFVQLAAALSILAFRFNRYAWLVLLVVPINVAIGMWQVPLARQRAREQLQHKTSVDSLTLQVIEGARDVKGLAAEQSLSTRLSNLISTELLARWRAYVVGSVDHGRYTASWLVMSSVYFVSGLAVTRGELSIGSLTAFVWYVGFLETPISRLWQTATDWQSSRASLERYTEVMSLSPEPEGNIVLPRDVAPDIELRDVSFRYDGAAQPALANVNLRFAAGQQIAIVGSSGAGKTTLISLILRLFDCQEGRILIGGQDAREYTVASLRRYAAIISQDPFLFDGTVRDNIRAGLDDCSEQDVREAAEVADADTFIRELPDGYDTLLGARGGGLSGGQKRRLAIARAIVRRPRVIILDEVTGALDSVTDASIQRAIERTSDGATVITVSHRLSSTAHADQIVVLERGEVVGTGTHDDLVRQCGSYRNLVRLQQFTRLAEEEFLLPGGNSGLADKALAELGVTA